MDDDVTAPVPTALRVAAVVVACEGLGAAVFGIVEALNTHSSRAVMGVTTSLFFVVYGAGLLVCARGLSRAQSWGRGPVLISQLIALGLAWNFRSGGTWPISVLLAVPAVAVLVAMLHPTTLAALDGPPLDVGDDRD
ncbi:MAG: hypothetical protein ACJ72D_23295 [Marmoricola sp.]